MPRIADRSAVMSSLIYVGISIPSLWLHPGGLPHIRLRWQWMIRNPTLPQIIYPSLWVIIYRLGSVAIVMVVHCYHLSCFVNTTVFLYYLEYTSFFSCKNSSLCCLFFIFATTLCYVFNYFHHFYFCYIFNNFILKRMLQ